MSRFSLDRTQAYTPQSFCQTERCRSGYSRHTHHTHTQADTCTSCCVHSPSCKRCRCCNDGSSASRKSSVCPCLCVWCSLYRPCLYPITFDAILQVGEVG